MEHIHELGKLSVSRRRGIITLLPKDDAELLLFFFFFHSLLLVSCTADNYNSINMYRLTFFTLVY